MIVFPAIDIYEGRAVRLLYGDYGKMTVYSDDPVGVACEMRSCGMTHIHIVDLEGARDGGSPNMELIAEIKRKSGLFCEVGGGIRTAETAKKYLDRGIDRVIFGTAAVTDPGFMKEAAELFGEKAAVGADVRDGRIAIRGWRGLSDLSLHDLASSAQEAGIKTLICTDISRDGDMRGANRRLYAELSRKYGMDIVASGGVSSVGDLSELSSLGIYGAIVGRAYYEGKIDLRELSGGVL